MEQQVEVVNQSTDETRHIRLTRGVGVMGVAFTSMYAVFTHAVTESLVNNQNLQTGLDEQSLLALAGGALLGAGALIEAYDRGQVLDQEEAH